MAQRVITYVQYTDDLTNESFGEGEGETMTFTFDGETYEVDLSKSSAEHFRQVMEPFVLGGRKTVDKRGRALVVGGGPGTHPHTGQRGPDKKPRRTRTYMAGVREWARNNGYDVPAVARGTGRLPESIVEAFEQANPELAWKES